jgi:hypothetical protein
MTSVPAWKKLSPWRRTCQGCCWAPESEQENFAGLPIKCYFPALIVAAAKEAPAGTLAALISSEDALASATKIA